MNCSHVQADGCALRLRPRRPDRGPGFTILELVMGLAIGTIMTVVAVPIMGTIMTTMRMNSSATAIATAISQTRYNAIMNSQIYTIAFSAPSNTYVVTNVKTGTAATVVPFASPSVALNGGTAGTYTFTLCPNGTAWGAGGICSPNPPAAPALSVTYQGRQTNINVSSVGNVTTTIIH